MKTLKLSDFISPALFIILSNCKHFPGKRFQEGVGHGVGQAEIRMRSPYTRGTFYILSNLAVATSRISFDQNL